MQQPQQPQQAQPEVQQPPVPDQPPPPQPIANEPHRPQSPSRSRSASRSRSESAGSSRSSSRAKSPEPAAAAAELPVPAPPMAMPAQPYGNYGAMTAPTAAPMSMTNLSQQPPPSMVSLQQTAPMSMAQMMSQQTAPPPAPPPLHGTEAPAQPFITSFASAEENKPVADSSAAAAVAALAGRAAAAARDAARDAAKSAEVTASTVSFRMQNPRGPGAPPGAEGEADVAPRHWLPDPVHPQMKPPVKLWLPEPSADQPQQNHGIPPPPPSERRRSPEKRSRSRGRRGSPSRKEAPRRRGGGWDKEETSSSAAAVAVPSRPAAPPGTTAPRGPSYNAPLNRQGVPEASPEALHAAVLRAAQVEAAGREAIQQTGQIPRGPPDLPTGTEVIEQKCVAYLIGRGGQALAGINAAAGVSIQIDQSTKMYGWSMANIYGTEEGATKAKMILRQKIAEYRPLRS